MFKGTFECVGALFESFGARFDMLAYTKMLACMAQEGLVSMPVMLDDKALLSKCGLF